MTDDDHILIRACLAQCARRLRYYENKHRMIIGGPMSLVEIQDAENNAQIDADLAEEAEGLVRGKEIA